MEGETSADLFSRYREKEVSFIPGCIINVIQGADWKTLCLETSANERSRFFRRMSRLCGKDPHFQNAAASALHRFFFAHSGIEAGQKLRMEFQYAVTATEGEGIKTCPFEGKFRECDCCVRSNHLKLRHSLQLISLLAAGDELTYRQIKKRLPKFLSVSLSVHSILLSAGIYEEPAFVHDGEAQQIFLLAVKQGLERNVDFSTALSDQLRDFCSGFLDRPEVDKFLKFIDEVVENYKNHSPQVYKELRPVLFSDTASTSSDDLMVLPIYRGAAGGIRSHSDDNWRRLDAFISRKEYICMEPIRSKSGARGLLIYASELFWIGEKNVGILKGVIERYPIITMSAAPLISLLHYPVGGKVFRCDENSDELHSRMNIRPYGIISISRCFPDCVTIYDVIHMIGGNANDRYPIRQFPDIFFNIKRGIGLLKALELSAFDSFAGYSYFLPDRFGYQSEALFSLGLDNHYDFSNIGLGEQVLSNHTLADGQQLSRRFVGYCWLFLSEQSGGGICDHIIKSLVIDSIFIRYDIHLLYFGTYDGEHYRLGILAPGDKHDFCYSLLVHLASESGGSGRYEIVSGVS